MLVSGPIGIGGGVLSFANDGGGSGGTISLGNSITLTAGGTIGIDARGLTGSTSGNTVSFGVLSIGTSANALGTTTNFTGANGYVVSLAGLNLPGSTGATTVLSPLSTTVLINGPVGNLETTNTGSAHFDTLNLGGTTTGNTIYGVISDSSSYASVGEADTRITKSNSSQWILAGANTYHGPTTISGGTLQLGTGVSGQDGTLGNTSGVTDNAALVYDLAGTQTPAYAISGSGLLTMEGTGTLNLTGTNTYTGGTIVEAGTLVATNNEAIDGNNLGTTSLFVGNDLSAFGGVIAADVKFAGRRCGCRLSGRSGSRTGHAGAGRRFGRRRGRLSPPSQGLRTLGMMAAVESRL